MSAGFTPAPWIADTEAVSGSVERIGYAHVVKTPRGQITVGHSDVTRRTETTPSQLGYPYVSIKGAEEFPAKPTPSADAHLIAAAPDLFEAADDLMKSLASGMLGSIRQIERLRDALDKARGAAR